MNKALFLSFIVSTFATQIMSSSEEKCTHYSTALTSGYVFKHDARFQEVYGHGIVNIITGDGYYYFCKHWGLGATVGYWRAQGTTNFLQQHTLLQQVPFTIVGKGQYHFNCGLKLYGALGAGFIWTKEKSYLADTKTTKGIGTLEAGVVYPVWRFIEVTAAFRYLFPPQHQSGHTIDVGGCDLRAGIGFSF